MGQGNWRTASEKAGKRQRKWTLKKSEVGTGRKAEDRSLKEDWRVEDRGRARGHQEEQVKGQKTGIRGQMGQSSGHGTGH